MTYLFIDARLLFRFLCCLCDFLDPWGRQIVYQSNTEGIYFQLTSILALVNLLFIRSCIQQTEFQLVRLTVSVTRLTKVFSAELFDYSAYLHLLISTWLCFISCFDYFNYLSVVFLISLCLSSQSFITRDRVHHLSWPFRSRRAVAKSSPTYTIVVVAFLL